MAAVALLVVFAEVVATAWSCMVDTQPPCATSAACQSSTWFVIDLASGARLCSNTYLPLTCLDSNQGIRCEKGTDPTWMLPDGRSVANNVGTDGYYNYNGRELLFSPSPSYSKFKGVYTCNQNEVLIHIGLYDITAINTVIEVELAVQISDLFNQSVGPTVSMTCTTHGLPPTCFHWYHNGMDINQTVSLVNASETIYVSSYTTMDRDSYMGNHTCDVLSTGAGIKHNSSSTIIETSAITKLNLSSPSTVQVYWSHPLLNSGMYSCVVHYKREEGDEISVNSSSTVQATIENLTENATYYITIVCSSPGSLLFPYSPIEITLSTPGAFRNVTPRQSNNIYHVSWLPPSYPAGLYDTAHLTYSASCNGMTLNTTLTVDSDTHQIPLAALKPGLSYTLSLFPSNVLGNGPETVLTVSLPGRAPLYSPKLEVVAVNSSSIRVTWELVDCFNSSGEPPEYYLTVVKINGDFSESITKPKFSTEHYFTQLEEHAQYEVFISAVNIFNKSQTCSVTVAVTTHELDRNSTVQPPTNSTSEPTPTDILPLIIGGAVGGAVLLAVCVIAVIIMTIAVYRTKKSKDNSTEFLMTENNESYGMSRYDPQRSEVPYFREFPENTTASEGETVYFTVSVAGNPEPTWLWTHMKEPLSSGGNIDIFPDGTLIIKNVCTDNSGVYQFIAKNAAGEISNHVTLEVLEEEEDDSYSQRSLFGSTTNILHQIIPIGALDSHVEKHHANENEGFNLQYSYLKNTTNKHNTHAASSNKPLNRYKNIVPYDDNRVVLRAGLGWECSSPYINASYIDGYSKCEARKFLATQGPLPHTITDFWHMVWQEKVNILVTLVNRVEGNKVKCEEYWPSSVEESPCYGPCTVKLLGVETFANFVIRELQLLHEDNSVSPRLVKQFHFTSWPDHGVPEHGSPLLHFHQRIMAHRKSINTGPILVHCSAGAGRTGTLIALDIALEQLNSERGVDISGIINKMRGQRMKMVQSAAQFIFLHDTILEHAQCGNTLVQVPQLSKMIQMLDTIDPDTGKTGFCKQYQVIQKVTPKTSQYKCSSSRGNLELNRKEVLPPSDQRRVILRGKSPDYINATFVDAYQQKKGYIITQNPMESTVVDFWRMIIQQNCSSIAMLCGNNEVGLDKDAACYQYWPADNQNSEVYDHFAVKLLSQDVCDNIVTRNLDVKDMNSGKCLSVTLLQITNWLPDGQCTNHRTILRLLEEILIVQRRSGNNPIVVHCSDTITRSGILCATSITVEQLKAEGTVDIFQVVKTLRIQRPGSVPSVDHYRMIYDLTHSSLSMFETYSNF